MDIDFQELKDTYNELISDVDQALPPHRTNQALDIGILPGRLIGGKHFLRVERQRQKSLKPCRCQRITVSGWTIIRQERQSFHLRANQIPRPWETRPISYHFTAAAKRSSQVKCSGSFRKQENTSSGNSKLT